jgi:hypothetical protein
VTLILDSTLLIVRIESKKTTRPDVDPYNQQRRIQNQSHVSIPLISSGVVIKDILDDGKIFTMLVTQLEIPKNMTI